MVELQKAVKLLVMDQGLVAATTVCDDMPLIIGN
jgi:hypothetical protein